MGTTVIKSLSEARKASWQKACGSARHLENF
jgi:hypothetical protein